jgi:hypothetical protein
MIYSLKIIPAAVTTLLKERRKSPKGGVLRDDYKQV